MAYSNSSAAYDLSAYQLPKEKETPELRVHKSAPRRMLSAAFSPRVLSSFAIVVTMLCLMVFNQVQLNEVSGDINAVNKQINELESMNIKLNSELESANNLRTIGDRAKNELGMHRLDKYQTERIYLQQEDKIELTESSPEAGIGVKVKLSVTSAIARLQEYIGEQGNKNT